MFTVQLQISDLLGRKIWLEPYFFFLTLTDLQIRSILSTYIDTISVIQGSAKGEVLGYSPIKIEILSLKMAERG